MQLPLPDSDWRPENMSVMLIFTAARLLSRATDLRLRQHGQSVAEIPVMAALKDGASLSQKELALQAGASQPSMAQLLARMEREGIVARAPDPADGRSSLFSLTDKAVERLIVCRTVMKEVNDSAVEELNEKERDEFNAIFLKMISLARKMNDS